MRADLIIDTETAHYRGTLALRGLVELLESAQPGIRIEAEPLGALLALISESIPPAVAD